MTNAEQETRATAAVGNDTALNGETDMLPLNTATTMSPPDTCLTTQYSLSRDGAERQAEASRQETPGRKRRLSETGPVMPQVLPPSLRGSQGLNFKIATSSTPSSTILTNLLTHNTHYSTKQASHYSTAPNVNTNSNLKCNEQTSENQEKVFSLMDAFCRNNDVLLILVSYLTIPSLINLYAMSKPFHYIYNLHATSYALAVTRTWAPDAELVFPWRCYKALCMKDPGLRARNPEKGPLDLEESRGKEQYIQLRDVPTIRWLQMVIYRHGVAKDILIQMATRGLRCPKSTLDAVKRMWFMLDLPLNAQRIALARNTSYWPNTAIMACTLFTLKLDMFFTDPAGQVYGPAAPHTNTHSNPPQWVGSGFIGCDLRAMLLAEKSFTPLWRVLRGWSWDPTEGAVPMTRLDVLRLWIRHKYKLPADVPAHVKKLSIMGIPWWEVGTAGLERTGVSVVKINETTSIPVINPAIVSHTSQNDYQTQQLLGPFQDRIVMPEAKPREPLLRPDQLAMREGIRRKMGIHRHWARMMFYGFCDEIGRNYRELSEQEILDWIHGKEPESIFEPLRFRKKEGDAADDAGEGENEDDQEE